MDYRKNIKLYEEDGKKVMCDFDIVLNRSMAVNGLKGYPNLVDVMFNGTGIDIDGKDQQQALMDIINEGKADKLFAMSDDFPSMLANLFPKMLDVGEIRVGDRDEIIEIAEECLGYDEKFLEGIVNFFMVAFRQDGVEKKAPKRRVKFTMN